MLIAKDFDQGHLRIADFMLEGIKKIFTEDQRFILSQKTSLSFCWSFDFEKSVVTDAGNLQIYMKVWYKDKLVLEAQHALTGKFHLDFTLQSILNACQSSAQFELNRSLIRTNKYIKKLEIKTAHEYAEFLTFLIEKTQTDINNELLISALDGGRYVFTEEDLNILSAITDKVNTHFLRDGGMVSYLEPNGLVLKGRYIDLTFSKTDQGTFTVEETPCTKSLERRAELAKALGLE